MRVVSREDVETMFQDTSDHHKVDMILHTISDDQLPSLLFIIMEHGLVTGLKSSTLILLESIYLKAFYFQDALVLAIKMILQSNTIQKFGHQKMCKFLNVLCKHYIKNENDFPQKLDADGHLMNILEIFKKEGEHGYGEKKSENTQKTKVVLVAVMRAQPRPRKIQENIVYRDGGLSVVRRRSGKLRTNNVRHAPHLGISTQHHILNYYNSL